jgi:hypothetical protein
VTDNAPRRPLCSRLAVSVIERPGSSGPWHALGLALDDALVRGRAYILAHRDATIRQQFIGALREAILALEATAQYLEDHAEQKAGDDSGEK